MAAETTPHRRAITQNRLFISYARANSRFVHSLCDHLLQDHSIDAWVDWQDIPLTAEWKAEIMRGIDSADAVAFIITPESLASPNCAEELAHAVAAGKRLLPVVFQKPTDDKTVPDALGKLNWIYACTASERAAAAQRLAHALITDLPALRMHARLLVRAREWIAADREASYLLRGTDLDDAQRWLSAVSPNGPFPSAEHREYLVASQQAQRAETQRWQHLFRQAEVRLLAAQSEVLRAQDVGRIELSALLAAASLRVEPTEQAAQSLQQGLRLLPPRSPLARHRQDSGADDLAVTPDGQWLLTAKTPIVQVHDTRTALTHASYDTGRGTMASLLSFDLSPDGAQVAVLGFCDAAVTVLSVPTLGVVGRLPHPGQVTAACWLGHTGHLVTACADNRVRRWDPATAAVITDLLAPGLPRAVAGSPDGAALAWVGDDGDATVLDLATGQVRWSQWLEARLADICFSPDGRYVATAGWDGRARLFDAATGEACANVHHTATVTRVCFSPDGALLASASEDGTAAVMTVPGGEVTARLHPEGGVLDLAFSPDSRRLATRGFSTLAQVWEIADQTEIARIPGVGLVRAVAFSADGAQLVLAHPDQVDAVWLDRDADVIPLRHGLRLQCAALDSAGCTAALAPGAGTVDVVDLIDGHRIGRFAVDGDIEYMQVSDHGAMVLTQDDSRGALTAWETCSGRVLWRTDPEELLRRAALSQGGRYVLVRPFFPHIAARLLRSADGIVVATLPHNGCSDPRFSPDGDFFFTIDGTDVVVRRTPDGAIVRTLAHSAEVMDASFSPDGSQAAAIAKDGAARVWECATGHEVLRIDHDGQYPVTLAFSPNGGLLATAGRDSVCVWDIGTVQQRYRFPVEAAAEYLRFTPDNAFIAAGSRDGRARIWALADGAEAACIPANGQVFDIQFARDGQYVLIEHCRGARRYHTAWRWRPDDLLALADASLTRPLTEQEWAQTVGVDTPMPLAADP